MLPIHFGHWRTVYGWFRELARRFLFQTIHDVERIHLVKGALLGRTVISDLKSNPKNVSKNGMLIFTENWGLRKHPVEAAL